MKQKYELISISKLPLNSSKKKKMKAVFRNIRTRKNKTVYFGGKGYGDYTIYNKTKGKVYADMKKKNYLARHRKNENWENPITAGSLSRYILWNKRTLKASIEDYIRRFFNR